MTVEPAAAARTADYAGRTIFFCSGGCRRTFLADPLAYLDTAPDPVCGNDRHRPRRAAHRRT